MATPNAVRWTADGLWPLVVETTSEAATSVHKLLLARRKTIRPRPGGEGHWRCEACGTITHAAAKPGRCPECGATRLWPADLAQPNVESGAG